MPVSGGESFMKPVERLTQSERRARAKKQREEAALVAQRLARGWAVRRMIARWHRAASMIQRCRRHRAWRYALHEAALARQRRQATAAAAEAAKAEAEAAKVAAKAEEARQRAEFESFAAYVNTDIPEELKRGTLLHYAATQISSLWRGAAARAAVLTAHGYCLSAARTARSANARAERERAAYAAEQQARGEALAREEAKLQRAQWEKEEEQRIARAKKARAEVVSTAHLPATHALFGYQTLACVCSDGEKGARDESCQCNRRGREGHEGPSGEGGQREGDDTPARGEGAAAGCRRGGTATEG